MSPKNEVQNRHKVFGFLLHQDRIIKHMPSNFARINNGSFTKVSSSTIYPLSGIYKKSLNSQRRVKVQLQTQHRFSSQVRHSSTTTSISAFNARKGIPVQLQHLHSSLNALHHDAILHLDLSQLKLALRGLESERLVTRIASRSFSRQSLRTFIM